MNVFKLSNTDIYQSINVDSNIKIRNLFDFSIGRSYIKEWSPFKIKIDKKNGRKKLLPEPDCLGVLDYGTLILNKKLDEIKRNFNDLKQDINKIIEENGYSSSFSIQSFSTKSFKTKAVESVVSGKFNISITYDKVFYEIAEWKINIQSLLNQVKKDTNLSAGKKDVLLGNITGRFMLLGSLEIKTEEVKKDDVEDTLAVACNKTYLEILSANVTNEEKIVINGKVHDRNAKTFNYNGIQTDFFGDVENMADRTVSDDGSGNFTIILNKPKMTSIYANKVENSDGYADFNVKLFFDNSSKSRVFSNSIIVSKQEIQIQIENKILADGPIDTSSYQIASTPSLSTAKSCRDKGIAPIDSKSNITLMNTFLVDPISLPGLKNIVKKITGGTYKFNVINKRTNEIVLSGRRINFRNSISPAPSKVELKYPLGGIYTITPSIDIFYKWDGQISINSGNPKGLVPTGNYEIQIINQTMNITTLPSGMTYKTKNIPLIKDSVPYFVFNIDEYNQKLEELKKIKFDILKSGFTAEQLNPKNQYKITLGIYEKLDNINNIVESGWAHSGYSAKKGTFGLSDSVTYIKKDPRFTPSIAPNDRQHDAERKISEYFAIKYDVRKIPFEKINGNIDGKLIIFADRTTCPQCQQLPKEIRLLLPNIKLIWVDIDTKECY